MAAPKETLQKLARELGLPTDALAAACEPRGGLLDMTAPVEAEDAPASRADDGGLSAPEAAWPWERYEDLGLLGRGGMGEVRLVRDRVLGRELAMKLLPPEIGDTESSRARFLAEARLTAQLQHPGIVPVYDCGALPDGLLWFTMMRVRGRTLGAVIRALHHEREAPRIETQSRVIDAWVRACEAVAYAHGEGVVHRDLKPDNVMIGDLGEVRVLDWGIARGFAMEGLSGSGRALVGHGTLAGSVLGTPAYMPPEQARGDVARVGPASDVYALGAILYTILCGEAPHRGSPAAIWAEVLAGPPPPLLSRCRGAVSEDLIAICERAMAREIADRPPDARALAEEVHRYLDGARRRERALRKVQQARSMEASLGAQKAEARALHEEARAALSALPLFAPEGDKAPAWALEDEARALDRAVALGEESYRETLREALREAPDLAEAEEALTDVYVADLVAAEEARDWDRAARAELLLKGQSRGRRAAILRGDGALSLVTDPEGAEVTLYRYVEHRRTLRAEIVGPLGKTPLLTVTLPKGSYLLVVRAEGRREMRYPVFVGRGERWDGARPGGSAPHVIRLLREDEIGEDEVFVPPGWFVSGGDPAASESLPRRRRFCDGFVMMRHPVTMAAYLAFMNDLLLCGRESEAESVCPRAARAVSAEVGVPLFVRGAEGQFQPGPSMPVDAARYPVTSVSWLGAAAYADWLAQREGRPWRLPGEEEREKATRGVDGRFFPWGDEPETTWANMVSSRPGPAKLAPIEDYATDESPYGIRGLAGNVRDWCAEVWTPEGPSPSGEMALVKRADLSDSGLRALRGGSYMAAPPAMCRAAGRFAAGPAERFSAVGIRLVRSA
ncbi:MAG: SUMF1/EgtB/PvdO family nonheme iron enzyme [Polyangiaceae bacterium]